MKQIAAGNDIEGWPFWFTFSFLFMAEMMRAGMNWLEFITPPFLEGIFLI
jgi:hypothetical protein